VAHTRRDYIVPERALRFRADERGGVGVAIDHGGVAGAARYGLTRVAHDQFAEKTGIPRDYYRRMLGSRPELLAENVNAWLGEDPDAAYLVRTLDGHVRALLSDRYRVLDNADLFFGVFDTIRESGGAITRLDLTEERFYLRVLVPDWRERIEHQRLIPGTVSPRTAPFQPDDVDADWVVPGIVISNSEVGRGSLRVEPFALRLWCMNGAVFDQSIARVHLGGKHDLHGLLSADTVRAENEVIWGQVRDLTRATLADRESFRGMVARLSGATGRVLAEPHEAIDSVVRQYRLDDSARQRILDELISAGDPTVFGLMQAITATARDLDDYDGGVALERAGGDFITCAEQLVAVR
jgi:hypothetical protein